MLWTEIGSVASESSKNTRYAISVNPEGDLGCKCMSWAHSKELPKVCKHVQSAEAGRLLHSYQLRFKPLSTAAWTLPTTARYGYQFLLNADTKAAVEDVVAKAQRFAEVPGNIFARANLRNALRKLGA